MDALLMMSFNSANFDDLVTSTETETLLVQKRGIVFYKHIFFYNFIKFI